MTTAGDSDAKSPSSEQAGIVDHTEMDDGLRGEYKTQQPLNGARAYASEREVEGQTSCMGERDAQSCGGDHMMPVRHWNEKCYTIHYPGQYV